jgi:DNA sulfur modification protein DndB
MLDNVLPIDNLGALTRSKSKDYETRTIAANKLDAMLSKGWEIQKMNSSSVRLKKLKSHDKLLEDRVWSLLCKMGFKHMSGEGGGSLLVNLKDSEGPKNQIDVVGIDDEIAIAVECKSSEKRVGRPQFQEELGKHTLIRERFSAAVNKQYTSTHKRSIVLVMFLSNIVLSDNDKQRAHQANVILFDDHDLEYYEKLVDYLGPAAKYQFFSDMLPGKRIPGLELRIPAIRTKMGGSFCYSFSISPEYLLKISYISHRAKGRASDVSTYQRMVSKSRLSKIKQYIKEDGVFPTNIVLNLEKNHVQFERIGNEYNGKHDIENGLLGWLIIRPAYKSAWIIDGQHRLYAYSGLDKATKAKLSILAFEGLLASKQAQLFVDINAKQKSVKQSLLQELYAELHWDSDDHQIRVRAVLSKVVQELGSDPDSALFNRIQTADLAKDYLRCITLSSVYGALEKTGFHIQKVKNGNPIEYGPLWAGNNEETLKRTVYILKNWLAIIRGKATDWWDKGSSEGGGLAMNDGVITCLNILRSVFNHIESSGKKLVHLDNEDLLICITPYAEILGEYLGGFTIEERKRFRDLRGVQGQTTRTKRCQKAIREKILTFNPQGLDEFIKLEKAQTNIKAKEIIDIIETTMQKVVIEELRQEYGSTEVEWWVLGVPKNVRLRVTEKYEQDDGKRGGKEFYFDLMDYKKIIMENWSLFEKMFAFKNIGNKEAKTSWLNYVNEKRNVVSHPSSAITITIEELDQLREYKEKLELQVFTGKYINDETAATNEEE